MADRTLRIGTGDDIRHLEDPISFERKLCNPRHRLPLRFAIREQTQAPLRQPHRAMPG